MSIAVFKPTIWSAVLQRHLDRKLIYGQPMICNRNWEGDIAEMGESVKIQKIGDPTIQTYESGVDLNAPERPTGTQNTLTINQSKAFNIAVDDIDAAQVNVDTLNALAARAAVKMAQSIDSVVSAKIVSKATTNTLGTEAAPITVKDAEGEFTPYTLTVEARRLLAEQNAPIDDEELWMVISPSFEALIYNDPKYIASGSEIGATFIRNGVIGDLNGFTVIRTTGVPTAKGAEEKHQNEKIVFGCGNYHTTFASQLTKLEAYRIQNQFGDALKGLELFGVEVIEPESLVVASVSGTI
jgi:capsid protein